MDVDDYNLTIEFGQAGNSALFRLDGWSEPEPQYTWTAGFASSLELPQPDIPDQYLLELRVRPFVLKDKIRPQRLEVNVNGSLVGDFSIGKVSSLECMLPWDLLEGRSKVLVEFIHRDTVARLPVNGEADERLLAIAFEWVRLRRLLRQGGRLSARKGWETGVTTVANTAINSSVAGTQLEGHVDAYGYDPASGSWVFAGWVSRPWGDDANSAVNALFEDGDEAGPTLSAFYERPGLQGKGIGFIVSILRQSDKKRRRNPKLISLALDAVEFALNIDGHSQPPVPPDRLTAILKPLLQHVDSSSGSRLARLRDHLMPDTSLPTDTPPALEGHVDSYAYDRVLGGWVFLGWISKQSSDLEQLTAVVRFEHRELCGEISTAFYNRSDVAGRGLGCIFFMPETVLSADSITSLSSVEIIGRDFSIDLEGHKLRSMPARHFAEIVRLILNDVLDLQSSKFLSIFSEGGDSPAKATNSVEGFIDFFGYHTEAGGWVFCGWTGSTWEAHSDPKVTAQFVDGDISGQAMATFYHREDIAGRGAGVVLFVPSDLQERTQLLSLALEFATSNETIYAGDQGGYSGDELLHALTVFRDAELQPDRGGLRARLLGTVGTAIWPPAGPEQADTAPAEEVWVSGHIDFYGYHSSAGGWLFAGWISEPWSEEGKPSNVLARFENGMVSGDSTIASFYYRDDIEGRGVGLLLSLTCAESDRNNLVSLDLQFAKHLVRLPTTVAGPSLPEHELLGWIEPLLSDSEADSNRARLRAMLLPEAEALRSSNRLEGFVDFYGYHSVAGGWLFCGWVSNEAKTVSRPAEIIAQFERGEVRGETLSAYYARDDLGGRGEGIVFFVPGAGTPLGGLLSVLIEEENQSFRIYPSTSIQRLREQDLLPGFRPIVVGAEATAQREALLAILARQGFVGADTIGELSDRVLFEIDEAIFCEPDGLVLIGWYLAKPGVVRGLRLCCGGLVSAIDLEDAVRIDRPDVLSAVGEEHGFDEFRCGFIAFLPHSIDGVNSPYVEIETKRREIGYRIVPVPKLEGIAAIKRLLECFDVRFLDVPAAYDHAVGPAIELLNKSRLKTRPNIAVLEFGERPINPEFSIVIPLYGRIDFVEYQLALFSAYPPSSGFDFIYVLDDPRRRREAQFLFASAYERFQIPFRALLFDRNVGFAPTNNIGLQHAYGKYVCFLNSDAFPGTPDWLERLGARLKSYPELGAVGPLLLYEDDSIQHQGMSFRQLKEFGNWYFGDHPGKGLQRGDAGGLQKCISITGACMLMERALAERTHGFDEAYAIGDFEDSDLCLRLYRMGLGCAVDLDVHLYHLERKSQAVSGLNWRMNLTLFNAWFHQRRWARAIAAHPLTVGTVPFPAAGPKP